MYYNKKLKDQIRQIQLDTIAIKRIRKEMEKELEGDLWVILLQKAGKRYGCHPKNQLKDFKK